MQAVEVPRFNLENGPEEVAAMLLYLQENGYAVCASVASPLEIEAAKASFWTFTQTVSAVLPTDITTWDDKDWLASPTDGICSSKGFNHSEFAWNTRCLPKVKAAFGAIWDTMKLIVSFDACNVFRPWKYNPSWLTSGGWWHVDQNAMKGPERQGKVCIQGLVTYYNATEDTGGLCVIPRSHLQHNEVCERCAKGDRSMDFISIPKEDDVLRENAGILVCAKAGDLILWDSRTIHCNTPALTAPDYVRECEHVASSCSGSSCSSEVMKPEQLNNNTEIIRLVSYVCMLPKACANNRCLEQRRLGFTRRVSTSHWPTQKIGINNRVILDPVDPATCSTEMLALVGYDIGDEDEDK
jgi:ectoine hydroxylase-related dioxygenase (phytanoyl-CoA dioxygenase family)